MFFFNIISVKKSTGLLNWSTWLGSRKLRFPTQQNSQIQCTSNTENSRKLQISAANVEQSFGESSEFVFGKLSRPG